MGTTVAVCFATSLAWTSNLKSLNQDFFLEQKQEREEEEKWLAALEHGGPSITKSSKITNKPFTEYASRKAGKRRKTKHTR